MKTKILFITILVLIGLSGIGACESYYLSGYISYNNWERSIPQDPPYSNENAFSYVAYATMSPTLHYSDYSMCWTTWSCIIEFADNPPGTMYTAVDESVRLDIPGCPPNQGSVTKTISAAWGGTIDAGLTNKELVSVGSASDYKGTWSMFVAITEHNYNLTGNGTCLDKFELKLNNSGEWITVYINESIGFGIYNYSIPIAYNYDYRIYANGNLTHSFTCEDHELYSIDACSHTRYRFEELCGNLIPDSEGAYTEYDGFWASVWDFYEPTGILDISNSSAAKIAVHSHTFIGDTGWIIDPVVTNTEYTLTNPNIDWGLKVIVVNESDGSLINGSVVQVNQDCYCTSETSVRQKMTVSGMVEFADMSLQDASLLVTKTGYKSINENSTGYSTLLSGRANFSSKIWYVKLAPEGSANESTFYEISNTVGIHFIDESGKRTSQINDTDSNVYLFYENNNTDEEAMTLKFQSSSTHTYFIDEQSWTIPHDAIGRKTIANSYFTPWDYSYRAVIYNSSIYGWNMTIPLTVRNATKQENAHYQNLTTGLFFMFASNGRVDYRDTMKIGIHACSNNTTLMTTDIELWKDGVYLCCKNLTAPDYLGSTFSYYYLWSPVYKYVSGSNYSVRMYGFDRTLLETDYVECITDSTTRKNKLTIGVKDRSGTNLNNCYIYLEDWGSLPTGTTYYNAYEGIDNGDYRYKASKSGYTASGWLDVTISDGDKIVWYTLTDDTASGAPVAAKMTNNDIKEFFFPIMFLLFICILLGGLKYVS